MIWFFGFCVGAGFASTVAIVIVVALWHHAVLCRKADHEKLVLTHDWNIEKLKHDIRFRLPDGQCPHSYGGSPCKLTMQEHVAKAASAPAFGGKPGGDWRHQSEDGKWWGDEHSDGVHYVPLPLPTMSDFEHRITYIEPGTGNIYSQVSVNKSDPPIKSLPAHTIRCNVCNTAGISHWSKPNILICPDKECPQWGKKVGAKVA